MSRRLRLFPFAGFAAALLVAPIVPASAGPIAASSGTLDINPKTFVVPLNSTVTGGVYAKADGKEGGKADVALSDPAFKTKLISIVKVDDPLMNVFGYPGVGLVPVAKFPGGNPTCGFITMEKSGANTQSTATSSFCTNIDTTKVKTKYTADLTPSAEVTKVGANPKNGIAVANVSDPWFFTPEESTVLDLTVALNDVTLVAESDSGGLAIAAIETFGSLSFVGADGVHVLAAWSYSDSVSGSTTKGPYSLTLLDGSFMLSPGVTYELDATVLSAAAAVPEPPSPILVIVGVFALVASGYRRLRGAGATRKVEVGSDSLSFRRCLPATRSPRRGVRAWHSS